MRHGREDTLTPRQTIAHQDHYQKESLLPGGGNTTIPAQYVQLVMKNLPLNGLFSLGVAIPNQESARTSLNEFRLQAGQRFSGLVQDLLDTKTTLALPLRYVPDFLTATPVLYAYKTREDYHSTCKCPLTEEAQKKKNLFHPALQSICDAFPNQQWRDMVQVFNRVCRSMDRYNGEVIPQEFQERMKRAAEVCDDVFVATPFHEVAVSDLERVRPWHAQRTQMQSSYVLGMIRKLPFAIVLGKVGRGDLFSAYPAMTAATIDFLRAQTKALKVLNGTDRFSWYYGDSPKSILNVPLGTRLGSSVEKIVQIFDKGFLFDWLKEGYVERM